MDFTHTLQGLAEVAAINGDACKSIYGVALKATERVYALNTDFARAFIESCAVGDSRVDHEAQLRAQLRQFERVSEYFRDVSEILVATHAEVFTLGSANAEVISRRLAAEVERQCLSSSGGQTAFSDALKSAINAASSTYEKLIGTSREIAAASPAVVRKAA